MYISAYDRFRGFGPSSDERREWPPEFEVKFTDSLELSNFSFHQFITINWFPVVQFLQYHHSNLNLKIIKLRAS